MQPGQSPPPPEQWQPPVDQGTQAPYVAPVMPEAAPQPIERPQVEPQPMQPVQHTQPVVTLTPEYEDIPAEPTEMLPPETAPEMTPVHWQAAEYIQRAKSPMWYVVFTIVVLVLVAIAVVLMHAWTFAILIPVMAAALVIYSRRPPRIIDYTLSRQGLHVNDRLYVFAEFKSFVVIHGDDEYSILLVPVKRFKPGVSIYFPEEAGEAIVDMLAARLPMSQTKIDVVDQVIRKLRI